MTILSLSPRKSINQSVKKQSPSSISRLGRFPLKKAALLLPNFDEKVLSLSGHQLIEKHVRRTSASSDSFQI
jgi:hypothetical protein